MDKIILIFTTMIIISNCSFIEDDVSYDSSLKFNYSNDTLKFDTLLSNRRSPSRRLVIHNPNNHAVIFSGISLEQSNSFFSMVINGKNQDAISNEKVLSNDSILILIELHIDSQNKDSIYLVEDAIVFEWNGNSERIVLQGWGQDGYEIRKSVICDEFWTKDRPYIISDTLLIAASCQLTIEKGARIFFEQNAGLFVQGTLHAIGDSSEQILFTSSRFDGDYGTTPGQWEGIYFLEGSMNNKISFAEISNGNIGLRIGTPDPDTLADVIISNTKIHTMSNAGILAFTSDVSAQNTLIYNCATYLVGNFLGGNYTYRHCTFSNSCSNFIHDAPSIQFSDNIVLADKTILVHDLSLSIFNSILWSDLNEELLIFDEPSGATVTTRLVSNIIRTTASNTYPGNITSSKRNYPTFINNCTFNFSLDTLSNAKDKGIYVGVLDDITGNLRDSLPDIGAYERIEKIKP